MTHLSAPMATPLALTESGARIAVVGGHGLDAVVQTYKALSAGMDVLIIDEAFGTAHEAALKGHAHELGRLVLGPGAGMARIDGANVGFATGATTGTVGIVSGSGSAARQVAGLLDRVGVGLSDVLVVGGSDLSPAVAGRSTRDALDRLRRTAGCHVIVALLWPADKEVMNGILDLLDGVGMPVVAWAPDGVDVPRQGVTLTTTLDEAARVAARMSGRDPMAVTPPTHSPSWVSRGSVLGLFCGGALCAEASAILAEHLETVWSNRPAGRAREIPSGETVRGHMCVDLGHPEMRAGHPHPMDDPERRSYAIRTEAQNGRARVLILDVPLGWAMHPDPAGALVEPLGGLLAARPQITVLAHVCGARGDPQGLAAQETVLRDAGVHLMPSNAAATALAARLVT